MNDSAVSGRLAHQVTEYKPRSGGWTLDVRRHNDPTQLNPELRPLVMVPGYAMNAFILGFHPTGRSMVEYLVDRGFEVWTANLRGQGDSERLWGSEDYGFRELAQGDLPAVRDLVLAETMTDRGELDLVGCSLGASVVYAYLALHPDTHDTGSVVAIGGPLRWDDVHPAIRMVFGSKTVASLLPTRGTRQLARMALPFVQKLPGLASIYMNVHQIELDQVDELVKTVDDPNRYLNRQIALWLNETDLVVDGTNITDAMGAITTPVLCLLANRDGIVPPAAALSIRDAIGTREVDVMRVGDDEQWYAHADLFISERAESTVFAPMANWLVEHASGPDQEPSAH